MSRETRVAEEEGRDGGAHPIPPPLYRQTQENNFLLIKLTRLCVCIPSTCTYKYSKVIKGLHVLLCSKDETGGLAAELLDGEAKYCAQQR